MKVLSFDVGIKNLAWCLLETLPPSGLALSISSGESGEDVPVHPKRREDCVDVCWKVQDWGVWDLRMDTEDERFHPTCCMEKTGSGKDCNREPVFVDISRGECLGGICKIHARRTSVPYTSDDIKGVSKKMLGDLRKMAEEFGLDVRGKLKKEIISGITEIMSKRYLFKIPAFKKAKTVTLGDIHDRIIQRIQDIHSSADVVLIENQPVKMNAAMKSVQMILWTTLRSRMMEHRPEAPDIRFINASKKLMVLPDNQTPYWGFRIMDNTTATRLARERNYTERKHESIARVEYLLRISSQKEHLEWFLANSKRDDLADCLLMCLYGACEKLGVIGKDSGEGKGGGDGDFDIEVDEILQKIGGEGSPLLGPSRVPLPTPSPLGESGKTNPREMSPLMLGMGDDMARDEPGLPPPSYLNAHMSKRSRVNKVAKANGNGRTKGRRMKDISKNDPEPEPTE